LAVADLLLAQPASKMAQDRIPMNLRMAQLNTSAAKSSSRAVFRRCPDVNPGRGQARTPAALDRRSLLKL
jgi:hypothetical protein